MRADKIAVSYGRDFRFEASLEHERSYSPMHHEMTARLEYPGRKMEAGFEIGDRGGQVGNSVSVVAPRTRVQ